MDFQRLHYFYTLAQSGSLREAAELLGLSSPALSKAMKVLETEVEAELWIKDGRKIILTEQGRTLLKEVPKILEAVDAVKQRVHQHKDLSQPFRIGTFEVFSTYFLKVLEDLPWDDFKLELHELLPGEIERHLIQGELDLGISYMPIAQPELDFLKVTQIEMGVFTRFDSFKGIEQPNIPFVTPVIPLQGVPTKLRGLDGWPQENYTRKVQYKVTLMESALELCRQGRVAGYFPCFIVEEHNKICQKKYQLIRRLYPGVKKKCYSDVYIIKRKSSEESQRIKQLSRVLRKIK